MTVPLTVRVSPKLKNFLVDMASAKDGRPMNEIVAEALAGYFKRPEFAAIPRKRMGRPAKKA